MKRFCTALLALTILETSAYAEKVSWVVDSKESPAKFTTKGTPGWVRISGEKANVEGTFIADDGKISGTFTVPLSNLTTGMELRDKHMKEDYLKVDKYPNAILTLEPTPSTLDGKDHPFKGRLKLQEQENPVSGTISLKDQTNKRAKGFATFKINLADYKSIGVPEWKKISVVEAIDVEVEIAADRESK